MDGTPFYKRPWFYIVGWLAVLLIVYGWQIMRLGGIRANMFEIVLDLLCLFPLLLIIWMAFFAQFVLPVRTFRDRQKIFNRLFSNFLGSHGPAIFIRNGQLIQREGEQRKQGAGVLWLDSASAAVTRTAVAIRQTLGPGVHFIDNGEYIAGTVDLHLQSQSLGPKESDKPFEARKDFQSEEEYHQIQDRRKQVSGLTRDGIEVIPNISILFRVNTGFPSEGHPGSRFGYRTGIRRKDRENEEKDKDAIRRAILGEGINPTVQSDLPRHRVAWNQLPAQLAVDLWREYVSKFTLDELFSATQTVPPPQPAAVQPTEEEIDPLSQPIHVGERRAPMRDSLTRMLREVNVIMYRMIKFLEGRKDDQGRQPAPPAGGLPGGSEQAAPSRKTALQVINDMVRARLTQENVDVLDETGVRQLGTEPSPEFELLRERGLEVRSVSIGKLHFVPDVEQQLIKQWSATWLDHAKSESERIERRRSLVETSGEEQALRQYADVLGRELVRTRPAGMQATLKALVQRSRLSIVNNEKLRSRMTNELDDIEEIIDWVERSEL